MIPPVILRPEADRDVEAAQEWYDQQKDGLGQEFLDQLSVVLERIADMPELFATIWEDVRSCQLRRFPFIVYYRMLPDRVEVLAVLHGSRDPTVWQSRA